MLPWYLLQGIARLALLYNKHETRVEPKLLPNIDHHPKREGQVQLSSQNLTDKHALCSVGWPLLFLATHSFSCFPLTEIRILALTTITKEKVS